MSVTIGAETLPNPSEEDIEHEVIGSSFQLANGQIMHDNILGESTRTITLTWRAVSASVKNDISDAWLSLFAADQTYTDLLGSSYTVTAPLSRDKIKIVTVGRSTPVYNVTIKMREVN